MGEGDKGEISNIISLETARTKNLPPQKVDYDLIVQAMALTTEFICKASEQFPPPVLARVVLFSGIQMLAGEEGHVAAHNYARRVLDDFMWENGG